MTDAQGRFRLEGLPKAESYSVNAFPRQGIDPFLGDRGHPHRHRRPRADRDDPGGAQGRDRHRPHHRSGDRPARAGEASPVPMRCRAIPMRERYAALVPSSLVVDGGFRITVPPGEGMIYAIVRGKDLPYSRARLRPADKGKGIGGPEDGETMQISLDSFHVYRMIDIPADAESFAVDLVLTRGETRKGKLVGPTGKPVTGAQCSGYGGTTSLGAGQDARGRRIRGVRPPGGSSRGWWPSPIGSSDWSAPSSSTIRCSRTEHRWWSAWSGPARSRAG